MRPIEPGHKADAHFSGPEWQEDEIEHTRRALAAYDGEGGA